MVDDDETHRSKIEVEKQRESRKYITTRDESWRIRELKHIASGAGHPSSEDSDPNSREFLSRPVIKAFTDHDDMLEGLRASAAIALREIRSHGEHDESGAWRIHREFKKLVKKTIPRLEKLSLDELGDVLLEMLLMQSKAGFADAYETSHTIRDLRSRFEVLKSAIEDAR